MAKQGLLGCGGHGCLGLFQRHKYEVVGSSNRSILYLGTSDLKVIRMIYAPPYDDSKCVVDWKLASSLRVTARAHKKETLERQSTRKHLLLRTNHHQERIGTQHETTQYDIASIIESD